MILACSVRSKALACENKGKAEEMVNEYSRNIKRSPSHSYRAGTHVSHTPAMFLSFSLKSLPLCLSWRGSRFFCSYWSWIFLWKNWKKPHCCELQSSRSWCTCWLKKSWNIYLADSPSTAYLWVLSRLEDISQLARNKGKYFRGSRHKKPKILAVPL